MDNTGAVIAVGFAPVINRNTHTLILGSMPGKASLDVQQYYAHPRNAFWPILCKLLDIPVATDYTKRLWHLQNSGIGLWDVLAQCERPGSLDSDIKSDSVITNNFVELFATNPQIRRLFFNGTTAEHYFRRHILPQLKSIALPKIQKLPSTSPAHASLSLEQKLSVWKAALDITI